MWILATLVGVAVIVVLFFVAAYVIDTKTPADYGGDGPPR